MLDGQTGAGSSSHSAGAALHAMITDSAQSGGRIADHPAMGRSVRPAGLVLGLGLVAVLLLGWRVPGGDAAPGASVSVTVNRTGELDVQPAGRLLHVRDMVPGDPARAAVARWELRNATGMRLAVRVRADASGRDLDEQLAIRIEAGSRRLFDGTLGELRSGSSRRLRLISGERAALALRAWLPPTGAGAYQARRVDVSLDLLAMPERRRACARC